MSSITQDVVAGVTGQRLHYDAPEGRPLSLTSVRVWPNIAAETSDVELATTGAASIEASPNTTIDESSGVSRPDPRRVVVAETTGIRVGRQYLLTNTEAEREWVEVRAIGDGFVLLKSDLENDYEPESLFQSTRMSIALDAMWINDVTHRSWELNVNPRYRVRWEYVSADDQTIVVDTYFDVLDYAARYSVTAPDVDLLQPGWIDRLPRDDREQNGRGTIQAAYDAVKWDLYGDLVPDQAIRNRELFERLIAAKAAWMVVPTDANQQRYIKLYEQLIRSGVAPIGTDVGTVPVVRRPLFWR